jgi:hypothetical protein
MEKPAKAQETDRASLPYRKNTKLLDVAAGHACL